MNFKFNLVKLQTNELNFENVVITETSVMSVRDKAEGGLHFAVVT